MASADGIKIDDADRIRAMGHDPAHFAGVVERVERVAAVSDDPF
jgi:hypothetical protein